MKYAGIITAAGLSSRMKDFKPLMYVGDGTMLECVVRNFRLVGTKEIVVVGGYKADLLKKHTDSLGTSFAENKDFASTGMFESFCIGLESLKDDYDRILVSPCDVPVIDHDTMRMLSEAEGDIIRPVCNGKGGHPVILSKEAAERIKTYRGDEGLRGAIKESGISVTEVEVDDIGTLMDADTPEEYEELRQLKVKQISGGNLWSYVAITLMKGDLVLNPYIAEFLDMIDHTGSIQNACTCLHMSYSTGWKLLNSVEKELGYPVIERKTGGENGGGSSFTEKGAMLLKAYSEFQEDVRAYSINSFEKHFKDLK